jgi:hypothetical protein
VPSNRRRCHKTGQFRALRVESQADRAVAWTSHFRHWSCRTFSWPAGLNAILVAGIATCWNPRTWLSFRTRRRDLEYLQLGPLSASLACGCALPSSLFSPALVSPCASRTRHRDDTAFFSLVSSYSHNHNRSISAMWGHWGRWTGEGPQARWY